MNANRAAHDAPNGERHMNEHSQILPSGQAKVPNTPPKVPNKGYHMRAKSLKFMVPAAGLEPATSRLQGGCSTS